MDAVELVTTLQRKGFTLTPLPEGRLSVKPADRITPAIRSELLKRKAEVLALLISQRPPTADRPDRDPTPGSALAPVMFWTDSRDDIDPENPPRPYLNKRDELVIPSECHPRYRWWNGGQSVRETLRELGASPDVMARYVEADTMRTRH